MYFHSTNSSSGFVLLLCQNCACQGLKPSKCMLVQVWITLPPLFETMFVQKILSVLHFTLCSIQSNFWHFYQDFLISCFKTVYIFQSGQVSMYISFHLSLITIGGSILIDFNGIWIRFVCSITYICLLSWNKPVTTAVASRELWRSMNKSRISDLA